MSGAITLHKIMKNPYLLVGLVLCISLIAYLVLAPNLNISTPLGSLTGFTVVSLDQMSYQSTNPIFNNGSWTMVTRVDGSGQYAEGTFTPELIYQKFGLLVAEPFTIEQGITEQACEYQVTNITYIIQNWTVVSSTKTVSCGVSPPAVGSSCGCSAKTGYTILAGTITSSSWGSSGNACDSSATCECPAYKSAIAGTVHLIDSSTTFFTKINTTLKIGSVEKSLEVTSEELEKQLEGVMYVKLTGYLTGQRTCPVPAADYSVWRPYNTMNYQIKDKYILNQVVSMCTNVNSVSGVQSCQSALAQIPTTHAAEFYNCDNATSDGFSTKIRCVPKTQAVIPETTIILSQGTLGITVPVAIPEIVNVTVASDYTPSANNKITVIVKNNANVSGAVDIALLGGSDIATVSKRVTLASGETQSVDVFFQGTGIIKTYTVQVSSVTDPDQKDTKEVRIKILPFCDKNKPSAQHVAVYTQYGCEWICPNQYKDSTLESDENTALHNIFESDCEIIDLEEYSTSNYQREDGTSGNSYIESEVDPRNDAGEKHCKELNKQTGIKNYIADNMLFIPENKTHQIWLSSPYCKYVAEYGYLIDSFGNSQEITEDYEFISSTPSVSQIVADSITTPSSTEEETQTSGVGETPSNVGPQEGLLSMNTLLIIVGVGIVIIAIVFIFRKNIMTVIK